LRLFAEVGRFVLTAVAVALVVPFGLFLVSGGGSFAFYPFFAIIVFVLSIVGGTVVGLPVLGFASRRNWTDSIPMLGAMGAAAGALFAALLLVLYSWGEPTFLAEALPIYSALGAIAGLIAASTWIMLHRNNAWSER
jgi:hypothetical protein